MDIITQIRKSIVLNLTDTNHFCLHYCFYQDQLNFKKAKDFLKFLKYESHGEI